MKLGYRKVLDKVNEKINCTESIIFEEWKLHLLKVLEVLNEKLKKKIALKGMNKLLIIESIIIEEWKLW